jgi:hypothetical protein
MRPPVPETRHIALGLYTMVTIFLELAPGTEFRIQKQQHELEALDLSIGSILTARWVKDHSFVLSQTDDG